MAVIKLKELKEKTMEELKLKLAEVEKEIHSENASVKTTGKPSNAGKYREVKKVRARINTLLAQRKAI